MAPGRIAGQRLRELRRLRHLSQQQLADRLSDLGHPIDRTALGRMETAAQGISADALVALAVALNVSPGWLLAPNTAGEETVEVVGSVSPPAWAVWQWIDGIAPLPSLPEKDGYNTDAEVAAFQEGRPSDLRQREQHPAMRAATNLRHRVQRVLHHVGKPKRKGDRGLETTLKMARQAVARVSDELDEIEQQAQESTRGGRR